MLLIPTHELRTFDGREDIDREAESVVIETYREASKEASATDAGPSRMPSFFQKGYGILVTDEMWGFQPYLSPHALFRVRPFIVKHKIAFYVKSSVDECNGC